MTNTQSDAELIRDLGGPTKVAEKLGFKMPGGAQRVQNWVVRGVPDAIKVKHPYLFMPELAPALANTAQAATESVAERAQAATETVAGGV